MTSTVNLGFTASRAGRQDLEHGLAGDIARVVGGDEVEACIPDCTFFEYCQCEFFLAFRQDQSHSVVRLDLHQFRPAGTERRAPCAFTQEVILDEGVRVEAVVEGFADVDILEEVRRDTAGTESYHCPSTGSQLRQP